MGAISTIYNLFASLASTPDKCATVLAVGLPKLQDHTGRIQLVHTDSARSAFGMLQVLEVDLVLVPNTIGGTDSTEFVDQLRGAWPWQRWGLVGQPTEHQETAARERRAVGVFEHAGD